MSIRACIATASLVSVVLTACATCPTGQQHVPDRDSQVCVSDARAALYSCWDQYKMTKYSSEVGAQLTGKVSPSPEVEAGAVRKVAIEYGIPVTDPCIQLYSREAGIKFESETGDAESCQAACGAIG